MNSCFNESASKQRADNLERTRSTLAFREPNSAAIPSRSLTDLWADDVEHDADHHSEEVGAGGDQADRASDPAHHVEEAEDALRALIVLRQIASRRQEQEQSAEMRSNGAVK